MWLWQCLFKSLKSPWSRAQPYIYHKTLSCNNFLRVKGICAVKPKFWFVMFISLLLPSLTNEHSSQLLKIISFIHTKIKINIKQVSLEAKMCFL